MQGMVEETTGRDERKQYGSIDTGSSTRDKIRAKRQFNSAFERISERR